MRTEIAHSTLRVNVDIVIHNNLDELENNITIETEINSSMH